MAMTPHIAGAKRHIQNMSDAAYLEPHWGYAERALPCKNDAGSCEYLDVVYHAHDVSMLYTFIMWAVIGGLLLIALAIRLSTRGDGSFKLIKDAETAGPRAQQGFFNRLLSASSALRRRFLLQERFSKLFGHVSSLQIAVLACVLTYLLIFSFVGLVYKKWITPVKNSTLKNTRTSLGPWSDRIGALAYALTPLTVMLASRESVLSLFTGIPYQHFMFMHRWCGRVIYIQSVLHTIGWTIIEAKLYQPQPMTWNMFISQRYMIWGCVAIGLITFLFVFSFTAVIKRTGYEFFRKSHYIVAIIYIGACWGHWSGLACWMIASLGLWGIDRGLRLLRTLLIHFGKKDPSQGIGFRSAQASLITYQDEEGTVARLDFEHPHLPWKVGQHFYLCFPDLTIWQSHPMTPMSSPNPGSKLQKHSYIIRGFKGETRRLAQLGLEGAKSTAVILSGPYGMAVLPKPVAHKATNVMAIAGGTGVSFTLPIVQEAVSRATTTGKGTIWFVWVIRRTSDLIWIAPELATLRELLGSSKVDFHIKIFVTRDPRPSSRSSSSADVSTEKSTEKEIIIESTADMDDLTVNSPGYSIEWLVDHHPNFAGPAGDGLLDTFLAQSASHGGSYHVYASGPVNMGRDLRLAVADKNSPGKVMSGDSAGNVSFYWDERAF